MHICSIPFSRVQSQIYLNFKYFHSVYKIKAQFDEEEASRQNLSAEQALDAEQKAEEAMVKAETEMAAAATEEDKEKAKKAGKKAKKAMLKNKEKRLRSTLKAAMNMRSKPRIDAGVEEAKEALPEIPGFLDFIFILLTFF